MAKKRYKLIYVPRKYVDITTEKKHPTKHIMDRKTGLMQGRKITTAKPQTRILRMNRDFSGFEEGQVIGRTRKEYPRQKNSVLVREHKRGTEMGRIKSIKVRRHIRRALHGKSLRWRFAFCHYKPSSS